MQGLEFHMPVKDIILRAMEQGLIIIAAGTNVIRFVPQLVITTAHVDDMIAVLETCLQAE